MSPSVTVNLLVSYPPLLSLSTLVSYQRRLSASMSSWYFCSRVFGLCRCQLVSFVSESSVCFSVNLLVSYHLPCHALSPLSADSFVSASSVCHCHHGSFIYNVLASFPFLRCCCFLSCNISFILIGVSWFQLGLCSFLSLFHCILMHLSLYLPIYFSPRYDLRG